MSFAKVAALVAVVSLLAGGAAQADPQHAKSTGGECDLTSRYTTVGQEGAIIMDKYGRPCVASAPGAGTPVTLDVKTVTTGATAVTALSAGHRNKGGWILNPKGATVDLCINEIGTAVGTVSSGDTTCIAPGQTYPIFPGTGAVSVISSDSAHPFSGMGFD